MLQYPRTVFVAALKRHYAVLQTLALEEDEMPDIKDERVPDEEGMPRLPHRPGAINALKEFKLSIYGDHYDEETENAGDKKESDASKKRKATSEIAVQEYAKYDWTKLADNGEVGELFCFSDL
ncbi:hypothetical protein CsatA_025668 [Cannabis sativa]